MRLEQVRKSASLQAGIGHAFAEGAAADLWERPCAAETIGRGSVVTPDPFDLQRFIHAQRDTYERALSEIENGRKRSHWMWYVFPQLAGLGHSEMARRYAISSLDEARAYLAHPVLGERLRDCVGASQSLAGTSADTVFGEVDAMKLRSSLTLFREATDERLFEAALQRWFAGKPDERTLALLHR